MICSNLHFHLFHQSCRYLNIAKFHTTQREHQHPAVQSTNRIWAKARPLKDIGLFDVPIEQELLKTVEEIKTQKELTEKSA